MKSLIYAFGLTIFSKFSGLDTSLWSLQKRVAVIGVSDQRWELCSRLPTNTSIFLRLVVILIV